MLAFPSKVITCRTHFGPAGYKGHAGSGIWWAYLQHGWGRGRWRGYPPICCLWGQQKGPCPTRQVFTGMPAHHSSPVLHAVCFRAGSPLSQPLSITDTDDVILMGVSLSSTDVTEHMYSMCPTYTLSQMPGNTHDLPGMAGSLCRTEAYRDWCLACTHVCQPCLEQPPAKCPALCTMLCCRLN